ncbi:MAG: glycosyl hydrolase family 2 [Ignavibacteriae bacterium]|nr:glycosyl hydrolase family 2 [Ignavibacteriota bacterium]
MKKILFTLITFVFSLQLFCQSAIKMPAIFSDNMVLQQNFKVPIWGKSSPKSKIEITTSWGKNAETTTEKDSSWYLEVETPKAGGPYQITVSSNSQKINFKNVLIGEVWLCSGQSNMEMPLMGWPPRDTILNSAKEIKNANYSDIRLFTVARSASILPNDNVVGKWEECNPNTVANFSATAFFFGKKLFNELKIPIGLIHSSWGGTPAEAWTNKEFLLDIPEYQSTLQKIEEAIPMQDKLTNWLNQFPILDMAKITSDNIWSNLEFNDANCGNINFDDKNWRLMTLPIFWERTQLGEFDGAVWFRKNMDIPNDWLNKDLTIELGPIDDFDITFVNGKKIGGIEEDGNYQTNRIYNIPAQLNNKDKITIAVRVNDTRGGGGFGGISKQMRLILNETKKEISIAGEWRYLPVAEFKEMKYFVFGEDANAFYSRPEISIAVSANMPTALYNGMIAPLIPYSIKGAIWYQGEANAGNPELYERLFPTMISNWRSDWRNDFPFYFAQIAPYNYGENTHSEFLRDAQRKTLRLANTGMAVTLDIGNNNNIHPANKTDVGERLALLALANQYGKSLVSSGPLYYSMEIVGSKIVISFNNAESGLVLKENSSGNEFLISGADKKFIPANVKIENNKIVIWSENIKVPLAVRYSWSNISGASLFNMEGLPASSFRTDDWE